MRHAKMLWGNVRTRGDSAPATIDSTTTNVDNGTTHTHELGDISLAVKSILDNNHESYLIENTANVAETVDSSWTVTPYNEQVGEFKAVVMVRNRALDTIITLMNILSFDYSDAVKVVQQNPMLTDANITLTVGVDAGTSKLYATVTGMTADNKRIHLCFERCVLGERFANLPSAEFDLVLETAAILTAYLNLQAPVDMSLNFAAGLSGYSNMQANMNMQITVQALLSAYKKLIANNFTLNMNFQAALTAIIKMLATINMQVTIQAALSDINDPWSKFWNNPILIKNGTTWEKDLVYVPRVLKNIDGTPYVDGEGKYWMYYSGGSLESIGSRDVMGLAKSSDLFNWTRYGQVFGLGTTYDKADVVFVTVVKDGDTWRAWYEGNRDAPPIASDYVTINYATSTDGINWTRHANNPILVQGAYGTGDYLDLYAPAVIKDGSVWKMWYTGHNAAGNYNLMYATAANPEGPWTKYSTAYIWTNAQNYISPSEVWKEGSTYWMTYYGGGSLIEVASSPDGTTWTKVKDLFAVSPTGWDHAVVYWPSQIFINGKWYTYYAGHDGTWSNVQIGLIISTYRIGSDYPEVPTIFTYPFTGTNNATVGTPWIRSTVGIQINMIYSSNKGTMQINGTGSTRYYFNQVLANNQYAQMNSISAVANSYASIWVRTNTTVQQGYELIIERWSSVWSWYLYAGSTLIAQGSATGVNAIRLEANGTAITAKKSTDNGANWTVLHSFTSTAYTSGMTGIRAQSAANYIYFDNFECGEL